MRQSISVEALINYLKEWCVKPEDANQEWNGLEVAEGTTFTTTVQHIHNVYTYLQTNCSQSSLKELFQHTPAVFIEYNRWRLTQFNLKKGFASAVTYIWRTIPEESQTTSTSLPPQTWDRLVFWTFLPPKGGLLEWHHQDVPALQTTDQ